jgi:hypothetical protein
MIVPHSRRDGGRGQNDPAGPPSSGVAPTPRLGTISTKRLRDWEAL